MTTPTHAAALALLDRITPGKWEAVPTDPAEGFECFWLRAAVPFGPPTRGFKIVEVATVNGPQKDEQFANARAIAALPELAALYRAGVEFGEASRAIVLGTTLCALKTQQRVYKARDALDAALAAVADKLGEGK